MSTPLSTRKAAETADAVEHVLRPRDTPGGYTKPTELYVEATLRELDAHGGRGRAAGDVDVRDVLTQLAIGEELARRYSAMRWSSVHAALRAGASMRQLADALDIAPDEVVAGFRGWVSGQLSLRADGGAIGLLDPDADAALALLEHAGTRP